MQRLSTPLVRYFLDTEFNGFGGALLSLALVPEDGGEFYVALDCAEEAHPWVERNVLPYIDHVPVGLQSPRMSRDAAARALSHYLLMDPSPEILADWPDDIAYFCSLLITGPGLMVPIPRLTFQLVPLAGFSTAENSAVPHNALHDARALREHVLSLEP
jgi:DNA polymerase III epsilon subunit-like protein